MVDKHDEKLSSILKAVSDPTRRSLLTQVIQQGPTRVTDLARVYDMSLNAISKHIKVLESAGLVTRQTVGRVHWIKAEMEAMAPVNQWLAQLKSIWEMRLDKLDELFTDGDKNHE